MDTKACGARSLSYFHALSITIWMAFLCLTFGCGMYLCRFNDADCLDLIVRSFERQPDSHKEVLCLGSVVMIVGLNCSPTNLFYMFVHVI